MTARLQTTVVNAVDPAGLAGFWAGLLGEVVVAGDADWAQVGGTLAFQSDPVAKQVPNRLHLDVLVDDLPVVTAAVLAAGGRALSDVQGDDAPWRVFADPEGNEFCLVTG